MKSILVFVNLAYLFPQIQHVNNELAKNLGILSKLRYYIDLNISKQIYYALIYPSLSYSILAWGCASKTRLDYLRIKHNKCLRTIFFVHSRESAAPYFKLLTSLKLDNIYKLKIYNNYSPKWRWLVLNIYRTAKQWGKYPRLATNTTVANDYNFGA